MESREEKLLRTAFLAGAITDALALVPMLSARFAQLLWGFSDPTGSYRFAMGYGASLMFGWTLLLLWAARKPLERRVVAALTVIVVYGLALTEIVSVATGALAAWRMIPTWILQTVLIALFASAYHYRTLRRLVAASHSL